MGKPVVAPGERLSHLGDRTKGVLCGNLGSLRGTRFSSGGVEHGADRRSEPGGGARVQGGWLAKQVILGDGSKLEVSFSALATAEEILYGDDRELLKWLLDRALETGASDDKLGDAARISRAKSDRLTKKPSSRLSHGSVQPARPSITTACL